MWWLLLALGTAQADENDDKAREMFTAGREMFNDGRFEEAIESWEGAWALSERPLIQFNLAEAYERVGRFEDALASLELYQPHAEASEKDQIVTRIGALRTRVEIEQSKESAAEAERLAREAQLEAERLKAQELQKQVAAQGKKGNSPIAPLVVTGLGVAMVGTGIAIGTTASSARRKLEDPELCTEALICKGDAESIAASQRSSALIADVTTIAGVAVTAAGTVWLLRQLKKPKPGTTVSFWAQPTTDGTTLGVAGAF